MCKQTLNRVKCPGYKRACQNITSQSTSTVTCTWQRFGAIEPSTIDRNDTAAISVATRQKGIHTQQMNSPTTSTTTGTALCAGCTGRKNADSGEIRYMR